MEVRALIITAICLVLAACGRDPRNAIPGIPLADTPRNRLLATTTDFTTGKLSIVDLTGKTATVNVPIASDAIVRSPAGSSYIYVVNRFLADNVQVVEKATGNVKAQFSVGSGTNPQDIVVVSDDVAYVSRLASAQVLKFNPLTGVTLSTLSGFDADADSKPELAWSMRVDNQMLVEEERLDPSFQPTDHSSLGVIDLTNDSVRNLTLARKNPVSEMRLRGGKLYLGEEGLIGVQDGGLERFDATTLNSEGIIVEESALGGDIVDADIVSSTLGIAIVGTTKTTLVSFDPSTGQKGSTLLDPGTYTLYRVLYDASRDVFYVADGDPHNPCVRVFDATTLTEKTESRISMPLPPYHLELTD